MSRSAGMGSRRDRAYGAVRPASRPRWLVLSWAAALVGASVALAIWLASALGHGPPDEIARAALLVGFVAAAVACAGEGVRLVSGRGPISRTAGRWLLGILLVAIVACFAGLEHEATTRDYGDEGIYLANARRVNEGWLLRPNFIYPHLLYFLDAQALWAADLFPGPTERLAGLWGVENHLATEVLVTRWITAGFGALVVLPVFAIGRRVAGEGAGLLGAALVAVSPLWVGHAHLNLSDVPSAAFATLCLAAAAALLDEETAGLYALAGALAGLAAGGKYPAGMAAVAIVAVWLRWRFRERRWGWGLVLAGAVAAAVFLLTTPSLLAFPEAIHQGEGSKDLLFGIRQYATRGWTGVVHGSNSLYYGDQLAKGLGLGALGAGLVGIAALDGFERRRLGWMLVFPASHLILLLAMAMAVPRNLLPILPALAAFLGCGLAGVVRVGRRRLPIPGSLVVAGVIGLALASPAWSTLREVALLARPTTREVAASWLAENLPPGSFVVREAYTPELRPPLLSRKPRFVSRLAPEELRDPKHDFVLVASQAYSRFLRPRNLDRPRYDYHAARYREILETFPAVRVFLPGRWRAGPVLGLYRLDPATIQVRDSRRWDVEEAVVSDPSMSHGAGIVFGAPGQWALFKEYLVAGSHRISVHGELRERARIVLRNRDNAILDEVIVEPGEAAEALLPNAEKTFLYLLAPAGSRVTGVETRVGEP